MPPPAHVHPIVRPMRALRTCGAWPPNEIKEIADPKNNSYRPFWCAGTTGRTSTSSSYGTICKPKVEAVPDAERCKIAAYSLGLSMAMENSPNYPPGCFRLRKTKVVYNAHPVGYPIAVSDFEKVCQAPEYTYERKAGTGYCNDYIHLDEGPYPPLLNQSDPLYFTDRAKECMGRCLALAANDARYARLAFSVRATDSRCTCSKGSCTSQFNDEKHLFASYVQSVAGKHAAS